MKKACEYFHKFNFTGKDVSLGECEITGPVKIDRTSRSCVVEIFSPLTVFSYEYLRDIEMRIAAAYDMSSLVILPHYPSSLFSPDRLSEIFEEASRLGGISFGFLDRCDFTVEDDKLIIKVFQGDEGINILKNSSTDTIIERLIRERFDISLEVVLEKMENSDFSSENFEEQLSNELDEYFASLPEPVFEENETEEESAPRVDKGFSANKTTPEFTVEYGAVYIVGNRRYDAREPDVIIGERPHFDQKQICDLGKGKSSALFAGTIDFIETKKLKSERYAVTMMVTDTYSSVTTKFFLNPEDESIVERLKTGTHLEIGGRLKYDKFEEEKILSPSYIAIIKMSGREDKSERKRVELHLHTTLSTMDAVSSPESMLDAAVSFGHRAIAFTDHGNVQSFPLVMEHIERKGLDIKPIYGIEGYFVDDTARAIFGEYDGTFDDELVVFDLETTGLSAMKDLIIEIGAVIISKCKKTSVFHTYVNPGRPIPPEITKLTGITDAMVKDAPDQESAVRSFLDFAGNRLLIAHNAPFDTGFIRAAAGKFALDFKNPYLDTVALSRYVNTTLKNHKLDTLAEHFGLSDWTHHTAGDDADMLARIFEKMVEIMRKDGIHDFDAMEQLMEDRADPKKLRTYHIIILAKDKIGLKNLYKLVTFSYLDYFHRYPRIPKTVLDEHREGLIVGSACESGELYQAILRGTADEEIERIADYYDYLEIQPLSNNEFLTEDGRFNLEDLKNINRKIVELGDKLGKPVCATCDAHYLNEQDDIYRRVLLRTLKFKDADTVKKLYFRTTDEMLSEFDYLGKDTAQRVVIDNPCAIADSVEVLRPIPKGEFRPNIEGSDKELSDKCYERAKNTYGDPLPDIVEKRLTKELGSIISNGFAVLYIIAEKLVKFSEANGYLVGSRGSVGSSFVAHMAGISEVNPLPPHYYCPKCHHCEFDSFDKDKYGSGFDLPDKDCPECGTKMKADGHDIPFETFLGFKGDKVPDIDLNFSGDVQGKVHKYTEDLFGSQNVFKAGTLSTLQDKTAFGFVNHYLEDNGMAVNRAEIQRIVNGITGVKRTTGQHPGGIVVVPKEYEIYDFMPVQHPADDPKSDIVTTHFAFSYLHDTLLKLDELGHDIPTKYKMLERFSGVKIEDVPMNDPAVYTLFTSTDALGVYPDEIEAKVGTYALPEFGTRFVQKMLVDAQPKNFSDLLQISGLSHGTDVWLGNAEKLIKDGVCTINDVFGTRDSIMLKLIRWGVEDPVAFNIMEKVRKGKGLTPEWEEIISSSKAPDWAVDSCNKIKYMFPKAHAAAYVMSAIRLGWYKVHYPKAFYAAYFSVAPDGFDAVTVGKGRAYIREIIHRGSDGTQNLTATEKDVIDAMLIVNESMARGIKYLPVNLEKSDAKYFLPEEDGIRMPFSSLPGLGITVAEKIAETVKEQMPLSREELKLRSNLGSKMIDLLAENGALDGLPETNQISLFGAPEIKKSEKAPEPKADQAPEAPVTPMNNVEETSQITLF